MTAERVFPFVLLLSNERQITHSASREPPGAALNVCTSCTVHTLPIKSVFEEDSAEREAAMTSGVLICRVDACCTGGCGPRRPADYKLAASELAAGPLELRSGSVVLRGSGWSLRSCHRDKSFTATLSCAFGVSCHMGRRRRAPCRRLFFDLQGVQEEKRGLC